MLIEHDGQCSAIPFPASAVPAEEHIQLQNGELGH
jgi:hypothetical protein